MGGLGTVDLQIPVLAFFISFQSIFKFRKPREKLKNNRTVNNIHKEYIYI